MKKLLFLFLSGLLVLNAQVSTYSPYSRLGIGDLYLGNSVRNQSMGGISVGSSHSNTLNRLNPASYRRVALTTFDISAYSEGLQLETQEASTQRQTVGVNAMGFVFPTHFKTSFAFGLAPYSLLGYDFSNRYKQVINGNTETYQVNYSAYGGLNTFYLGGAVSIFRHIDIGLNVDYVFGGLNYRWNVTFPDLNNKYESAAFLKKVYQQGFDLHLGMQYTDTIRLGGNRTVAKGGFTFQKGASLNADQVLMGRSSSPFKANPDTLIEKTSSQQQIPSRIGVGIELEKYLVPGVALSATGYWSLGMDLTWQDWRMYKFFGEPQGLGQSIRWAAGGEWIPRVVSRNYILKMAYRLGGYVEKTPLILNDRQLNAYAVTFGLGLPFSKTASRVHLGMELGRRGTADRNLIKEGFIKLRVGITLNEPWFTRYRLD